MSTNIVVPELGESVIEATVARWLKKEGDEVRIGEPLVELETDKIDLEVGAAKSGVLARISRAEGTDVKIGEVLGVIEDAPGRAADVGVAVSRPSTAPAAERVAGSGPSSPEPSGPPPARPAHPGDDRLRATPTARRVAAAEQIDLASVLGTGEGGRVTRQDVEGHVGGADLTVGPPSDAPADRRADATDREADAPDRRADLQVGRHPLVPEAPERTALEERVRMSRRRQTIARRLVEAQRTAAMLTTFNEVDMTAVVELRQRHKESFRATHGVGLGITSFFVKASVVALRQFPRLNAEIQGDEMVLKRYYDIGVAVGATEGLVVPVLRDADRLSFADIERRIKDSARKASDGSLTLDDLRGGTFTITNGGVFGSLLSTPILNPPQVGILGLHKIEDRAVPRAGHVAISPMMYLALSYDHRIVDGLEAVQFLVRIKEIVEDPAGLLFEA
jgi:2-oxoglutarate dehydrogenase E2 component (dihydrolipoamide succinyltransferase)